MSWKHFNPYNSRINLASGLVLIFCACTIRGEQGRDPFWPIGYTPESSRPAPQVETETEDAEPAPVVRELTDEELRELARTEADRIRQTLRHQATMTTGNRIFALLEGKWVTVGDTLDVEVHGNTYRLEILQLTADNIELEAHRTH